MAAARRFVTDISSSTSAFARDVLLDAWRDILPDQMDLAAPLRITERVRLLGQERLTLTDASEQTSGDSVAAGSLAHLWNRAQTLTVADAPDAVGVSIGAGTDVDLDALAAAVTAVAGEQGVDSVRVIQLDPADADVSKRLVRALRRITDRSVSITAHAQSVELTATTIAGCRTFATHDHVAAVAAASMGVSTVTIDTGAEVTELYLALRGATLQSPGAESLLADSLAFALDAWRRGRLSTAELRARTAVPRDAAERLVTN